jgi:hypothetical protein
LGCSADGINFGPISLKPFLQKDAISVVSDAFEKKKKALLAGEKSRDGLVT